MWICNDCKKEIKDPPCVCDCGSLDCECEHAHYSLKCPFCFSDDLMNADRSTTITTLILNDRQPMCDEEFIALLWDGISLIRDWSDRP